MENGFGEDVGEGEGCGASWQDVWALTDMTEMKEEGGGKTKS